MKKKEVNKVKIDGKNFYVVRFESRLGDSYKHTLHPGERKRITGNSGTIPLPHTAPTGMHIDLIDTEGHEVGKLREGDFISTTSIPISGSIPANVPCPPGAMHYEVGVLGNMFSGTINSQLSGEYLEITANDNATLQVAFW